MSIIKKAVFPVAGMGTRFLPATKATPKEMLPVVDKPLIQYAVEEAIEAGIKELIFVTSSNKRAIEDHFDRHYELEKRLEEAGKAQFLSIVRDILPQGVSCSYVRQAEPLGLGHAVLCAESLVGAEPFAVILADDLIANDGPLCLSQMVEKYNDKGADCVLAVQEVPEGDTHKYGIVATESSDRVIHMVEKPKPENAPSRQAVVGRYILSPEIFTALKNTSQGAGGEIQLTDAIASVLQNQRVLAYPFTGKRYDCGSKLGFLEATLDYALDHPELGLACQEYLQKRFQSN
ncbi:UTP--glucose-1-phosphate uridylyltransferase [Piscirickettsia salmonis]|uniref:UTP--glucose-1-phosphate uridylyltransferase n=1 Tax=Piscirickettsia salmonis TaxID=1238 RepID=A0A1L6T9I4_PISSA|nr:UTP--glucose-1-phosphate uridylyltransferase GalU [Piscirickettsia salmonis]AKP73162.2 UTP--glucose-1-phosphate uridylyltransferase [Piscirickettsia salmonis LF-89 = ATCC VR-1361]ALB21827.1 ADP-glucose pyrophosphorylase [Piscirickettsia salmonis]ALY02006.1 UTP--glucose-1-phosphate uridylyltransferase [Piscirickettsia salmonis]AMA41516.1 UTP--glucose-1-phosphate uridylyltransferase [Piscirickettsia salmonis]AOS34002.1 UTP--glucose-1-phosphate uridylyltransferase [Piscirickettsia salmonis]